VYRNGGVASIVPVGIYRRRFEPMWFWCWSAMVQKSNYRRIMGQNDTVGMEASKDEAGPRRQVLGQVTETGGGAGKTKDDGLGRGRLWVEQP